MTLISTSDKHVKYLTVGRLKELLADLPDELLAHPNLVGNILIAREAGDDGLYSVYGFIDFMGDGSIYKL